MTDKNDNKRVDALIFDMDGTLWDAVDSYAVIWNVTLDRCGIEHRPVTRAELLRLMGSYLDKILDELIPNVAMREELLRKVMINEAEMMPELGGTLYPGVKESIPRLAKDYRLFMVSNCGDKGLENFVTYNGFDNCFTDLLSHGSTGRSKTENILALIEKYDLRNPVYVGDTQGDADSSHKAGIPFIWTRYGFGDVKDADAAIDTFGQLPEAVRAIEVQQSKQC